MIYRARQEGDNLVFYPINQQNQQNAQRNSSSSSYVIDDRQRAIDAAVFGFYDAKTSYVKNTDTLMKVSYLFATIMSITCIWSFIGHCLGSPMLAMDIAAISSLGITLLLTAICCYRANKVFSDKF